MAWRVSGTQEAIAEQLRLGQELRRKVERPGSESSEDESGSSASEASDDEEAGQADANGRPHSRRAAAKMKAAALDIINGEVSFHLGYTRGDAAVTPRCAWPSKDTLSFSPSHVHVTGVDYVVGGCKKDLQNQHVWKCFLHSLARVQTHSLEALWPMELYFLDGTSNTMGVNGQDLQAVARRKGSQPRGCLRCHSCDARRSGGVRRRRLMRPPCCASWRRPMRARPAAQTRTPMTGRPRSRPSAAAGCASRPAGSSHRMRCACSSYQRRLRHQLDMSLV